MWLKIVSENRIFTHDMAEKKGLIIGARNFGGTRFSDQKRHLSSFLCPFLLVHPKNLYSKEFECPIERQHLMKNMRGKPTKRRMWWVDMCRRLIRLARGFPAAAAAQSASVDFSEWGYQSIQNSRIVEKNCIHICHLLFPEKKNTGTLSGDHTGTATTGLRSFSSKKLALMSPSDPRSYPLAN